MERKLVEIKSGQGVVRRGEEKRQEKEKEVQCEDRKSWRGAGQRGTGWKYHE